MSGTAERAPRKRLSLAVSLLVQGEELPGYCMNVSNSGMLVLLAQELPVYLVWSLGFLTGVVEDVPFRIKVRIARADEERVGLAFQISQQNDRELIRTLLEAATDPTSGEATSHENLVRGVHSAAQVFSSVRYV